MSGGGAPSTRERPTWHYDAAAALVCLVVYLVARNTVRGLEWPCESDLYRDMGAAQTLLDGRLGDDPAYLGERWWYPPLVPSLVGALSFVTGAPTHAAFAKFGAALNLLAPLGLYALVSRLLGRGPALASLIAFLFFGQADLMSWLNATYSPWLWPCNLAQGFFYFALFALLAAVESEKLWIAAVAGLLLGLTFLAHAAPGLLLGVILLVLVGRELIALRGARPRLRLLARAGVVCAVALVVAAPFALDILLRYGGKVKNSVPLSWLAGELAVSQAGALARRLISVRGLVAVVGLVGLFWPRLVARRTRWALASWFVCAALGLAYGYAAQQTKLRPIFPSWHFYFYLQAFESVAFGVGALSLARLVERLTTPLFERYAPRARLVADRVLDVAVAGLLVLTLVKWKAYTERPDLSANRSAALAFAKAPENELYYWVLRHAEPTDVVLTDPGAAALVAAAGRKVLWLTAIFSNPYVKVGPRARDGEAMLTALAKGREDEFRKLARRYQVRFVALRADQRELYAKVVPSILKRKVRTRHARGYDVYAIANPK